MATHPIMGLGLFIFAHDEWKKLYVVNCANHSMIGYANVPVGFVFSTMGIVCELLYIPFMIVMCRQEFMQHSCYKFMFLLGIIDMVTLLSNAIISGFQAMNGIHYCTNPAFFYVVGCIGVGMSSI
uniref:Uncharacterized protein n=1 Tax=Acrobeloides nanus TaxID=290746 RepID=A0A914CK30_9BILA